MRAFEQNPNYMATKSDYYTHVMDIPPQYGPGYSLQGSQKMAAIIGIIQKIFVMLYNCIVILLLCYCHFVVILS